MLSFLRKLIGRFLGPSLLLGSLFIFAGSVFADPTDPDGGDDPDPPIPRPYSAMLQ